MKNCNMQDSICQPGCQMGDMYGFAPAMAYVPWQQFKDTYQLDHALEVGTIFPELEKPFLGRRVRRI